MTSSSDLQSLLKRLEKATSRLEELSSKRSEPRPADGSSADGPSSDAGSDNKSVREYEMAVKPQVDNFVEISSKIGGVVDEQAQMVAQLYAAQRDFIRIATVTKKPSDSQLPQLLSPQQEIIQKIIAVKDSNRPSEFFDNLSAVAEGIAAFGWVAVQPTPVPYITDMKESAEFYSNRVLKKWRDSDSNQVDWVKAFLSIPREMAAYVKQYHTTGVVWNPHGGEPEQAIQSIKSGSGQPTASSSASVPPPPPPLPTAEQMAEFESEGAGAEKDDGSARGALFADLNKGSDITSGLRKVSKDQMTHKNPALRSTRPVKVPANTAADSRPTATTTTSRPKRMELQNDKWFVENYGTEHITIEATATKQTVYMYNCKGTTLDIKNKINSVAIDNCQKCGVVFDSLVSQCEIVNCKSVQIQARETVPSVLIDRTDGAHVFLSQEARDQTQITTAKASEVNVSFPYETENPEDDNFVEQPVPEQLQTVVKDGKLVTTVLEHAG
ncbi:F-actin-capping protein subunit alpha [Coemansia brasiliensis]|uniref:Adenylyl cyclase-associated protein n=1 Tax=Coemansia brasiliensis TaxID=2650707 RepID=A0A9W8M1P9_9FUNG|nr:F-actin-capping protein subunit alpha [Coemansia brasiliensis]